MDVAFQKDLRVQIHMNATLAVVGSLVLSLTAAMTASAAHAVRTVPVPDGDQPAGARIGSGVAGVLGKAGEFVLFR